MRDLFHEAMIIAINAVKFYYNIDGKTQFNTYLTFIIRREIKDSIDRYSQAVTLSKHIIDKLRRHRRVEAEEGPMFQKLDVDTLAELTAGMSYLNSIELPVEQKLEAESLETDIRRVFDSLLDRNEQFVVKSVFGIDGFNQLLMRDIAKSMEKRLPEVKEIYFGAIDKLKSDEQALTILNKYY